MHVRPFLSRGSRDNVLSALMNKPLQKKSRQICGLPVSCESYFCGKTTVRSILNASTAYTACGILAGITIASPALHWYFTPPTVNSPTPSRTVTMASPVESCVPICPMFLLIFMNKNQSRSFPSTEMVVTCHGMNLPLFWRAFLAAISRPPQHGTSMRTMVTLAILLFRMISSSFSL